METAIVIFPIAFLLHDAEEIFLQHKWMLSHREFLTAKFPKLQTAIDSLCKLNTKAFAIAATEELVVILLATVYALCNGIYSLQIWSALFIAFTFHFIIHTFQAILVRGYIPGLATTILLLPYSIWVTSQLFAMLSGTEFAICSIIGIIAMVLNLKFAHYLGKKFG